MKQLFFIFTLSVSVWSPAQDTCELPLDNATAFEVMRTNFENITSSTQQNAAHFKSLKQNVLDTYQTHCKNDLKTQLSAGLDACLKSCKLPEFVGLQFCSNECNLLTQSLMAFSEGLLRGKEVCLSQNKPLAKKQNQPTRRNLSSDQQVQKK